MTTKFKIICGFVIMMVLMGGIAVLGYKDLGETSDRFLTFRRHARINVYASDIMANLGSAGTQANAFILTRDPKALEACMGHMDTMDKLFADAMQESQIPENQKMMAELRKAASEYKAGLAKLAAAIGNMQEQYDTVVAPNGMVMANLLDELAANAKRNENLIALGDVEEVWSKFGLMLSALGRFGYSRADADLEAVETRVAQIRPLLQRTGGHLNTAEGKATFAKLDTAAKAVFSAIEDMKLNARAANGQMRDLGAMRRKFTDDMAAFNGKMDTDMRAIGRDTIARNTDGQRYLMTISVGGIVIGALLAIFIIVGIMRVLAELSAFAEAIANGDFSRHIKTREKGEIGIMVGAMKRIPEVLQRVIADIGTGVTLLQGGHYRGRLNADDYPGAYGDLVSSVNTVAEAYTTTLDELPVPILTGDKT
ncbi:MAG: methyl-accepting chemotaxis protein, partial [Deltaproteobacteria bacterium]|nr:methyl-accepting chemotaxis protein [Deltaproteobacteria bacterium]